MKKSLVYVASSWKNSEKLGAVHLALGNVGLETWDFRLNGFWWEDVAPEFLVDPHAFLNAPQAIDAFAFDKKGLDACQLVVAVMPAGVSTALEVGYAAGRGVPVIIWGEPREPRFDIMWKFATRILPSSVPLADVAATAASLVRR
jgi:hypothetical protein